MALTQQHNNIVQHNDNGNELHKICVLIFYFQDMYHTQEYYRVNLRATFKRKKRCFRKKFPLSA